MPDIRAAGRPPRPAIVYAPYWGLVAAAGSAHQSRGAPIVGAADSGAVIAAAGLSDIVSIVHAPQPQPPPARAAHQEPRAAAGRRPRPPSGRSKACGSNTGCSKASRNALKASPQAPSTCTSSRRQPQIVVAPVYPRRKGMIGIARANWQCLLSWP